MDDSTASVDALLQRGAQRLTGHQRRLFLAEVTPVRCGGNARQAERRSGWGRPAIDKGLHESRQGIRRPGNFAGRGRSRWEDADPRLAAGLRESVGPHTQAGPERKSPRRYTSWSAAEVIKALRARKGYAAADLPGGRTTPDTLNRMGCRLRRVQKGRPLRKAPATDATVVHVKAVREEVKPDPTTRDISMDTKAAVTEGDYARGGKKPDGFGRGCGRGVGS